MKKNLFATDHGKPSATLPSHITSYWLNLDDPSDAAKYEQIKKERKAQGVRLFDCIDTSRGGKLTAGADDSPVTLETAYVFNNQWNTTDGRRVFDWYESIMPNRKIKIGHYLQITPAMVELRANTCKCGYCGHEYYGIDNAGKFCPACLDSPYLKIDQLHLLRVLPVSTDTPHRKYPTLTPEEEAALMPVYLTRQATGANSRAAAKLRKEKEDNEREYKTTTERAKHKRDGLRWLFKNGINTENVIFYDHTDTFSFGWRSPLAEPVRAELTKRLQGFPFKWEFHK